MYHLQLPSNDNSTSYDRQQWWDSTYEKQGKQIIAVRYIVIQ